MAEQQLQVAHLIQTMAGNDAIAYEPFLNQHAYSDQLESHGVSVMKGDNVGRVVQRPLRVSFDGNIGVGKSTILGRLQSHPRLQHLTEVLQEPIGEWQNVNDTGLNMLQAFYTDPQRYAYLFQSFVFITRFLQQNSAALTSKAALLLMERSVLTDRCVYVETLTEKGYFNPLEVAAYEAWYHGVVAALPNVVPDAFVYLRADPNVCHERLKIRARSEEVGVSLDYLKSLHQKHETWFIEGALKHSKQGNWEGYPCAGCFDTTTKMPVTIHGHPVFVVDCSQNIDSETPSEESHSVIDQIASFLLGLSRQTDHV